MPAAHEFTVGTTPLTVFQRRGCGHTRAAGTPVVALPGIAVLSSCAAAACFPAIRMIKRWLGLGGLTHLEEEPRAPLPERFPVPLGGGAALTAAKGSGRET